MQITDYYAALVELRHSTTQHSTTQKGQPPSPAAQSKAQAAALFSTNPARFYGLHSKGRVAAGADADLIFLDADLQLVHVLAKGRKAVIDGTTTLRGTFSE